MKLVWMVVALLPALLPVTWAAAMEPAAQNTSASQELTLEAVLQSAQSRFPDVIQALADQEMARQGIERARSAFDPRISSESYVRSSGFWDGSAIDNQVKKRIGFANAEVYGGYRISRGEFPLYEDELFTNRGGETKIGIALSLLRDRSIDPDRLALTNSAIASDSAALALTETRQEVQRQATRSYQNWLAAGFKLNVYRELLAIAEQRDAAIARRIVHGDAAPILQTENRRNLLRRKALVVEAEQEFVVAGQSLSLFWRGLESGEPQIPSATMLPPEWRVPEAVRAGSSEALVEGVLSRHPLLGRLDNDIAQKRQQLRLLRNRLAPKLDLRAELSNDFGGGSATREGVDTIVQLQFELPLGLRAQRSELRAAEAELRGLRSQRQLQADRLRVSVLQLIERLNRLHEGIQLALDAEVQNELLETAERELFEQGASDFFLLNLREENTADARIQRIQAKQRFLLAKADYEATLARDFWGDRLSANPTID